MSYPIEHQSRSIHAIYQALVAEHGLKMKYDAFIALSHWSKAAVGKSPSEEGYYEVKKNTKGDSKYEIGEVPKLEGFSGAKLKKLSAKAAEEKKSKSASPKKSPKKFQCEAICAASSKTNSGGRCTNEQVELNSLTNGKTTIHVCGQHKKTMLKGKKDVKSEWKLEDDESSDESSEESSDESSDESELVDDEESSGDEKKKVAKRSKN